METPITAPAGAAATDTSTTEVVSATIAAADKGDVSAFLEADRAARVGKPAEKVQRPVTDKGAKAGAVVAGKFGEAAKGPSAADQEADRRLQTRIQEAVDKTAADLRAENADLRRRLDGGKPAEEKPAAKTAPTLTEEVKRILALAGAPKAEDFDTTTELAAAQGAFINETRTAERAAADRDVDTAYKREAAGIERVKTFHGRIQEYKAVNPEFATKLTPEVRGLHGFARLNQINAERVATGQPAIPATVDHAIAEAMYDSDVPAQVGVYLSEHPEALTQLRAAKTPEQLMKLFGRIEDKAGATPAAATAAATDTKTDTTSIRARADAAVERSVSSANPPVDTLGKPATQVDPIKKAIDTGDIGAFLELDRQEMAERKGLARR